MKNLTTWRREKDRPAVILFVLLFFPQSSFPVLVLSPAAAATREQPLQSASLPLNPILKSTPATSVLGKWERRELRPARREGRPSSGADTASAPELGGRQSGVGSEQRQQVCCLPPLICAAVLSSLLHCCSVE